MKRSVEHVVIGPGGLGSAALYSLSFKAEGELLGLEQFKVGHDRGASQDHSRIIRLAQHQPEYAALVPSAYEAWHEVERESGQRLVFKTGGLARSGPGAELLVDEGVEAPIWTSGNAPGGDEANARFIGRFRGRIRKLVI